MKHRRTLRTLARSLGVLIFALGGWIASTLVRLGDLKFEFLPPDPDDD